MTQELINILKLLPEHFNKENTLKFINCFKPNFEYIEKLIENEIGMTNIDKASGEYLDYIGYKYNLNRSGMSDAEFRSFIKTSIFKRTNAPTTANLITLTKSLTGFVPAVIEFYPNGEPASQYLKFIVPYTTDLSKFPDYNEIIDAGARIYRDIVSIAGVKRHRPQFTAGMNQLNMYIEEVEVPTGGRSR